MLANAGRQSTSMCLTLRVRQQAGSYRARCQQNRLQQEMVFEWDRLQPGIEVTANARIPSMRTQHIPHHPSLNS